MRLLCLVCKKPSDPPDESVTALGVRGCICQAACGVAGHMVKHPLERLGEFTVGTHIVFRSHGRTKGKKTNLYGVWPKDDLRNERPLGSIQWHGPWRRYAFSPLPNTIYEQTCMEEIAQFMREETREQLAAAKAKRKAARA